MRHVTNDTKHKESREANHRAEADHHARRGRELPVALHAEEPPDRGLCEHHASLVLGSHRLPHRRARCLGRTEASLRGSLGGGEGHSGESGGGLRICIWRDLRVDEDASPGRRGQRLPFRDLRSREGACGAAHGGEASEEVGREGDDELLVRRRARKSERFDCQGQGV
jgi:hypothetical protein